MRALSESWIRFSALDMTDPEALPLDHVLYSLPYIGSATHGKHKRMTKMACENLLAGLEGKKLPNCVIPEAWRSEVLRKVMFLCELQI